jgi:hypothetical protein
VQPSDIQLVADVVAQAMKAAQAPLLQRIAVLEAREVLHGKDGAAGRDGKDADPVDVHALKDAVVSDLFGVVPSDVEGRLKTLEARTPERGEKGDPGDVGQAGRDGKDAAVDLDALALKAAELIPIPKDGANGEKGADGVSVTVDDVRDVIVQAVAEHVQKAMHAVVLPKDGVGIASAVIDLEGNLSLTLTDGTQKALGRVVGAPGRDGLSGIGQKGLDGKDGSDGLDGLGFDDIHVDYDGDRTFTIKFRRGDREKSFGPFSLPTVLDRGVYEAGKSYEKGDGVSFAGSFFIAQKATNAKPETSRDWRLAIKRGRDGRDSKGK